MISVISRLLTHQGNEFHSTSHISGCAAALKAYCAERGFPLSAETLSAYVFCVQISRAAPAFLILYSRRRMSKLIAGYKREVADRKKNGTMCIQEGKKPLQLPAYLYLCGVAAMALKDLALNMV